MQACTSTEGSRTAPQYTGSTRHADRSIRQQACLRREVPADLRRPKRDSQTMAKRSGDSCGTRVMITLARVETTLTCFGGIASPEAKAERTRRPRSLHTQVLREREQTRVKWRRGSHEPGGPSSVTNDLRHRARRGRSIPQSGAGRSSRPHVSEYTLGGPQWTIAGTEQCRANERCRVQTFEAEAQRRDVPGDAQEWSRTRHGGVHDHAEKCNKDPEQSSSGRDSFYTLRARRGETTGLGSPRPRGARE